MFSEGFFKIPIIYRVTAILVMRQLNWSDRNKSNKKQKAVAEDTIDEFIHENPPLSDNVSKVTLLNRFWSLVFNWFTQIQFLRSVFHRHVQPYEHTGCT